MMTFATDGEQRVWESCFGCAWANLQILGVLDRLFPKATNVELALLERRQRCELIADEAVMTYRALSLITISG